ncbi:carbohydrate-binding module family 13 protein [Hyaloscypha bicolor E]|uniref:Carbohydrate-binding module family 13 protein n=1 Tax=Hyaloscypha bicolor E TaxID=1095630 RepID=A0A2J6T6C9_9HELO|nr:carbohydrate-binding module family 13 protein [Hyaloscypha bicolor E]PMD58568.1 carbohydrate-binding module family 13 protein [Hyaloscypha bicolor E]
MSDYTGPGVYILVSVATGTIINLSGANPANKTPVIGFTNDSAPNAQWQIADAGNGQYLIINVATGTYLTGSGGANGATTGNLISPTDKTVRYTIVPAGNGAYIFYNVAFPASVLNLSGASAALGTPVLLWPESAGAKNEQWYIKYPA